MKKTRSKWCFAVGCTGRDLCYTLVSLFLLTYIQYTNLVNTDQFMVLTAIIVLCRVWDAVNDPLMGTIISNTRTKFGKYRPWVLIGCILNVIFLVGLFTIRVDVGTDINTLGWYNVAILGVFYLLWGMTYTMNDVAYWSLLPVLSKGKVERDKLTTMVAVFASIGAFISGGIIPMVTPNNMIEAYRICVIIFAAIFFICQMLVFFFVYDNKENKFKLDNVQVGDKEETVSLKDMLKILFGNKQLLVMAGVVLLHSLASAILNAFGQNFFYFKFGYSGDKMLIFTVMYAIGTIISQALYPYISSKFKRSQIVTVSLSILTIGYILFFVIANITIPSDLCFILLCLFGALIFFGQGVFYMAMLIMLTNTIEYDEWKTGKRNDAITFSVRPFMVKLAGAVQYLVVAVTIVVCGLYSISEQIGQFEANKSMGLITEMECANSISDLLSQVSHNQILGLTIAMTLIPIILYVLAFVLIKKKYIIDENMYEKMIKEISERGK